jgi:hypothetical protein
MHRYLLLLNRPIFSNVFAFTYQIIRSGLFCTNGPVENPFLQKYTQVFTAPISFHHTADIF